MAAAFPPDFEVSLTIALRMVRQSARVNYAGKLPHQHDAGSDAVAKALVVQLSLQGWEVSHLPVSLEGAAAVGAATAGAAATEPAAIAPLHTASLALPAFMQA